MSGLTQAKDVPDLFFENYRRYMNDEWSTNTLCCGLGQRVLKICVK